MRGVLPMALVAVLLAAAGCLEGPAEASVEEPVEKEPGRTSRGGRNSGDAGDDEDEDRRDGPVTRRSFQDTFGLTLTSASALIEFNLQGSNCVLVEGAPFEVLNGTATLSWSASSPLADSLAVEVGTYSDEPIQASGPSPLVVEFEDLEVEDDEFEDVLRIGVRLPGPVGAAYEQDVQVELAFDYESDIDVGGVLGYC